ncbi:MAG: KilA-N domain-containing protein [Bacteroidales bacterium]|nr:KilA-N domain-containing protein [Bacteroidales bacterium]
MKKKEKINVQDTEISVTRINNQDYICISDMIKAKDGEFFISDWLRNRNTLEYIGIWEQVHNPIFNYGEFAIIKSQSGLNRFKLNQIAIQQMQILIGVENRKLLN